MTRQVSPITTGSILSAPLASRASKLEVELREVDCERKAVSARL